MPHGFVCAKSKTWASAGFFMPALAAPAWMLETLHYEYIDYSTASLKSSSYSFSTENKAVSTEYTAANNIRIGGEIKTGIVAWRGGYSFYGSPYRNRDEGSIGSRNGYSLGMGIRDKGYFLDFAYNHTKSEAYYYLYDISPSSTNTMKTNLYSLTLGFRF